MIWVTCTCGFFYNLKVPQPPTVVPGQATQLEMPDIPKVKLKVKPKESKTKERSLQEGKKNKNQKTKKKKKKKKQKNRGQAKLREKPRR